MCLATHHRRKTCQRSHVRTTHSYNPLSRCPRRRFPTPTNDRWTRSTSLRSNLPPRSKSTSSTTHNPTTTTKRVYYTVVFPAHITGYGRRVFSVSAFWWGG